MVLVFSFIHCISFDWSISLFKFIMIFFYRLRKIFFTVLKNYKQISKTRNCTGRKLYLGGSVVKNSPTQETRVRFLDGEDPLEKEMAIQPSLPRKSHEQRSLAGYSP